jgi:hypothetical protein
MSLRPVELQIALHKNNEAGLIQNQLNQKPGQDQSLLASAATKEIEKERQVTGKADDVQQNAIRDQEREAADRTHKKTRSKRGSGSVEEDTASKERRVHPYKGKHIDLSL